MQKYIIISGEKKCNKKMHFIKLFFINKKPHGFYTMGKNEYNNTDSVII